jgi:hypothetical protein
LYSSSRKPKFRADPAVVEETSLAKSADPPGNCLVLGSSNVRGVTGGAVLTNVVGRATVRVPGSSLLVDVSMATTGGVGLVTGSAQQRKDAPIVGETER